MKKIRQELENWYAEFLLTFSLGGGKQKRNSGSLSSAGKGMKAYLNILKLSCLKAIFYLIA
jgi:hypothetical protein